MVERDPDHLGDAPQVDIRDQQSCRVALGYRRDRAVDQTAGGYTFLPASSVNAGGTVEVGGYVEAEQVKSQQQASKVTRTRALL